MCAGEVAATNLLGSQVPQVVYKYGTKRGKGRERKGSRTTWNFPTVLLNILLLSLQILVKNFLLLVMTSGKFRPGAEFPLSLA